MMLIQVNQQAPLKKLLNPHLESFEKIEQWTDLGNWLQKTAKFLETYPTKKIPRRKTLSKRLSQCLNGNLPIGIHRTTLTIYQLIFEFMKEDKELMAKEVYIYSFGLFPFFVKSSIQVKPEILKIYKQYIIPLGLDIVPMLSGLIGSLLPGLEEQDENLKNQIFDIFRDINQAVGNKFFITTLWMILLKNSKNRISCFKVLMKKFQGYQDNNVLESKLIHNQQSQDQQEMIDKIESQNSNIKSYYTNSLMIANALARSLEDEDTIVKKVTLDFMVKFIDINSSQFKRVQWKIILKSMMLIFTKNDLSLVKRFVKFVFKKADLQEVNIQECSEDLLKLFDEVYGKFLIEPINSSYYEIPYIILQNISTKNENFAQRLLSANAFNFFKFCYLYGFKSKKHNSTIVLEETKKFIKNNPKMLEKSIEFFQLDILDKENFNEIEFLTFILKFVILDQTLSQNLQQKFIGSLLIIASKLMTNSLKNSTISQRNIILEQQENIDVIIEFSFNCINQFKDMININEVISEENKKVFHQSLVFFTELIQTQTQSIELTLKLIHFYSKIFEIIIILDHICNQYDDDQNEFPNWMNVLLKTLDYQSEAIIFENLQILHNFHLLEKQYFNIQFIQNKIYQHSEFESSGWAYKIFSKLMDIIEIQDFKQLFLVFYMKFVKKNCKFVYQFLMEILDQNKLENFIKVFKLWQYTHEYVNSECIYILSNSVGPMFNYRKIKSPIVCNYLKNWLTFSPQTFQIIMDNIFKKNLLCTNWKLIDSTLIYNHPFNCQDFLETLGHLKFALKLSEEYFDLFLTTKKVNKDFSYYQDELNQSLLGVFDKENPENVYIFFMFKIYLRFFIGEYNSELGQAPEQHSQTIIFVKEEIAQFLEQILKSLSDDDIVAQISGKILPYILLNLSRAYSNKNDNNIINFMNFLKFICFQTKLPISKFKDIFIKEMSKKDNLDILVQGLNSKNIFLIEEINSFFMQFNIILTENFHHPELTFIIEKILEGYLMAINNTINNARNSIREQEVQKTIQFELLKGLRTFYIYYLSDSDQQEIEERNLLLKMFTLGMAQGERKTVVNFKKDKKTCEKLLSNFSLVFNHLQKTWEEISFIKELDLFGFYHKNFKQAENLTKTGAEGQVVELIVPLTTQFQKQVIDTLLTSWIGNNILINEENYTKREALLESTKVIDIILSLNIPIAQFLTELRNTEHFERVQQLKRYKNFKTKKYYILDYIDTKYETDLLSFIYCYLKYSNILLINIKEIYSSLFELLKLFENSFIPSTLFWILDILNMLLGKVATPIKEFETIKYKYQQLLNVIISHLVRMQNEEIQIRFGENDHHFGIILPLNPSVHDKLNNINENKDQSKYDSVETFLFDFQQQTESVNSQRYRYFNIITFQKTFINICNAYYNDSNQILCQPQKIRIFFEKIWKQFTHRKIEDAFLLQKTSSLILDLIKENKQFLLEYRNEILEIFQSDEFFNCSVNTLKIWSKIINFYLSEINADIVSNYFEKINFTSMFSSRTTENKLRIKSFQRICFIIFSGEREQFLNKEKLKIFLIKIKEVLKDKNIHPNLIILIFFSLRILILRLKQETLDDLFKSMWSSILFLLDKMIQVEKFETTVKQDEIVVAALKLLELISHTDLEQFNLHRWAFLYEYFGIEFSDEKQNGKLLSPFIFKPILSSKLKPETLILFDLDKDIQDLSNYQTQATVISNHIPQDTKIDKVVKQYLQNQVAISSINKEFNQLQLEQLIYGDFIDFRSFINTQFNEFKIFLFLFKFLQL